MKKAKKSLVEQQRKAKKQEEQKKKQEDEQAKKADEEAKALEHAKSIVLTEDESLPKAEKVREKKKLNFWITGRKKKEFDNLLFLRVCLSG